jgi:two-component system, OmpR family, sensor histidine kinase SenX3
VTLALVVAVVAAALGLALGFVAGRRAAGADGGSNRAAAPPDEAPPEVPTSAVDRLPGALWNLPIGLVVAEVDGTVVYRNAVAEAFTDARHGDALVEAAIRELLAAGGTGHGERIVDLYGPPRRRVVLKATPMLVDGTPVGCLVMVEDVTEQQRIDTVRRDFVANVSHELKTPVGAIGVLAEALQGEDDLEVVDRLADRLQAEALRLGHTIDDLLALSRIESGELFQPAELDLDEVVTAALERTASPAERREVAVIAERSTHPVVVLADRRQLVSAVGNLIDNAIKYSDPGSEVVVSVSSTGERGLIGVRDHGIGIPAADVERIFERFYRVDRARSRDTGGTGLGLSIVRHVVQAHGGEVGVDSKEGEGSVFTLVLPLTTGSARNLSEAS